MKFRHDSDEMVCGEVVPGEESERFAAYGGIVCMRVKGHSGPPIGMVRDAAIADGRCAWCRRPLDEPHRDDCDREETP